MTTKLDFRLHDKNEKLKEVWTSNGFVVGTAANFAMDLMKCLSPFVPCEPELYYSSTATDQPPPPPPPDYQRMRALSPGEIADRAIGAAQRAFAEFERLGWTVHTPPFEEFLDDTSRSPGFVEPGRHWPGPNDK
jgi:hypothetical protein